MTVKAILSRKGNSVVTIEPTVPLSDTVKILDEQLIGIGDHCGANPTTAGKFRHLPVVERGERLSRGQRCNRGTTAMRTLLYISGTAIGLALRSGAALAATRDEVQTLLFGQVQIYVLLAFVIIVAVAVYFKKWPEDKRQTPLNRIFEEGKAIHSVAPDTPVSECVRLMTASKIGALIVLDGERLIGIFTERDALNKVLGGGLDPGNTKVSEVMTKDPYCIRSTTTVADAMKLITKRRFRHLPIVDNGKVLAVVSSGDLTHWLVQDQTGEVQELVDFAARS